MGTLGIYPEKFDSGFISNTQRNTDVHVNNFKLSVFLQKAMTKFRHLWLYMHVYGVGKCRAVSGLENRSRAPQ